MCYVGITRARQKLYLSYAEYRRMYGNDSYNPPSRFIKEIPDEHTDFVHQDSPIKQVIMEQQTISTQLMKIPRVFFRRFSCSREFGLGTILSIEGEGELSKVQVNFADFGTKWLVLGYANLENKLIIENKGLINYQECRDEMIALVKSSPKIHHIWVVEHPPVFTIGISEKNIEEDLSKNPPVIKTDRGGKITFMLPVKSSFILF